MWLWPLTLTTLRSSNMICLVISKCRTNHILLASLSSNWFPSILYNKCSKTLRWFLIHRESSILQVWYISLFNSDCIPCLNLLELSYNAVGYRKLCSVSRSRRCKQTMSGIETDCCTLTGCSILQGKFEDWFCKIKMHLMFTNSGRFCAVSQLVTV